MGKITKSCKVIGVNDAFKDLQGEQDDEFILINISDSVHNLTFKGKEYLFDIKGCIFTKKETILLTGFLSDNTNQVGKIAFELFN
jgi:hypothetical protein